MMLFFRSKAEKELDFILQELKNYLSNNYKDKAHDCRKLLGSRAEELYAVGKQTRIILTCLKWQNFGAFRLGVVCRRQPYETPSHQKSSKILLILGRRILRERIFGFARHKTQRILSDGRVF